MFGDGSQTRALCYPERSDRGLVAMMRAPDEPGPVNLGNPHELTVLQIAEVIRELHRLAVGDRAPAAARR